MLKHNFRHGAGDDLRSDKLTTTRSVRTLEFPLLKLIVEYFLEVILSIYPFKKGLAVKQN